MTREDMLKKLGESIVNRVRVVNHFSWDRCDYVGASSHGTRVSLNRDFLAGEVRIPIGGVFPHSTPGFGGGAKLGVPGVASIDTCHDLHGPHGLTPPLEGVALSRDWSLTVEGLPAKHGRFARVAMFPWSAIQLAVGEAA